MSIKIILEIEGNIHNIKDLEWGVSKSADYNGYPNGEGHLTNIHLTIEAVSGDFFEDWSFSNTMKKDFKIIMTPNVQGTQPTRILNCFDGYLIGMRTHFNSDSNKPMFFNLNISCGGFEPSYSDTKYSRWWRKSYPFNEKIVNEKEEEQKITDCFITDLEGNETSNLEIHKEVLLNIRSENLVGQIKDIDLANFNQKFEYNDEMLENNVLYGLEIKSNHQKVKLKIANTQNTNSRKLEE